MIMFNMYMLVSCKIIKIFNYKDFYLIAKLHKNNKINKKVNVQV